MITCSKSTEAPALPPATNNVNLLKFTEGVCWGFAIGSLSVGELATLIRTGDHGTLSHTFPVFNVVFVILSADLHELTRAFHRNEISERTLRRLWNADYLTDGCYISGWTLGTALGSCYTACLIHHYQLYRGKELIRTGNAAVDFSIISTQECPTLFGCRQRQIEFEN